MSNWWYTVVQDKDEPAKLLNKSCTADWFSPYTEHPVKPEADKGVFIIWLEIAPNDAVVEEMAAWVTQFITPVSVFKGEHITTEQGRKLINDWCCAIPFTKDTSSVKVYHAICAARMLTQDTFRSGLPSTIISFEEVYQRLMSSMLQYPGHQPFDSGYGLVGSSQFAPGYPPTSPKTGSLYFKYLQSIYTSPEWEVITQPKMASVCETRFRGGLSASTWRAYYNEHAKKFANLDDSCYTTDIVDE